LRLRIVSIWLRCFWSELRLEISDLSRETTDRGEWLSPFGFPKEDDPMGIAPLRARAGGWVCIGVWVRFFDIPAIYC
jgi:hypothetical protein